MISIALRVRLVVMWEVILSASHELSIHSGMSFLWLLVAVCFFSWMLTVQLACESGCVVVTRRQDLRD